MGRALYIPSLWRFLITTNDYFENTLKPFAKKFGITVSQLKVIYFTHKLDKATVGSVAKVSGFARTNTSSMCKKLTKLGFLMRKKSKSDERIVEITLTEEGKKAAEELETAMAEYESTHDVETLKETVELLSAIIAKNERKNL